MTINFRRFVKPLPVDKYPGRTLLTVSSYKSPSGCDQGNLCPVAIQADNIFTRFCSHNISRYDMNKDRLKSRSFLFARVGRCVARRHRSPIYAEGIGYTAMRRSL